jgi:hypothetical protein
VFYCFSCFSGEVQLSVDPVKLSSQYSDKDLKREGSELTAPLVESDHSSYTNISKRHYQKQSQQCVDVALLGSMEIIGYFIDLYSATIFFQSIYIDLHVRRSFVPPHLHNCSVLRVTESF